jgi:hypothetical protein
MLAVSRWEADKAKKAKDIILWSIIWFICVLTAYYTINLVIWLMYTL